MVILLRRAAQARVRSLLSSCLSHRNTRWDHRMSLPEDDAGKDDGEITRAPSHVPGLDAILNGGFLHGGLYMLQGPPGAGKTILASQMVYGHAATGGHA